jgi:hypothetical protein
MWPFGAKRGRIWGMKDRRDSFTNAKHPFDPVVFMAGS